MKDQPEEEEEMEQKEPKMQSQPIDRPDQAESQQLGKFRCQACGATFRSQQELQQHNQQGHAKKM